MNETHLPLMEKLQVILFVTAEVCKARSEYDSDKLKYTPP